MAGQGVDYPRTLGEYPNSNLEAELACTSDARKATTARLQRVPTRASGTDEFPSTGRSIEGQRRNQCIRRTTVRGEGAMPGKLVHFEIPADDTAKGREFWGSLFGWQFEAFPGPFEYHMTQISDQTGGAITNMEPGKQGTRAYFDVDEINAGTARVKELGGDADEPRAVPGMGWFAICRDTGGNEFGLWQNDPSVPAPTG
jgi:predicted enzyme related to lactoylglutathione lyase